MFYHVTYVFQSESTLYSCLNFKKLLARNRRDIWSLGNWNGTRTHNLLIRKQTLNHLAKLAELSGSGFKSRCSHLILRILVRVVFSELLINKRQFP